MQLVRFLIVGVLNTCVGLSCIFAAMWLFDLDYRVANALGYAAGCGVGFVLNRLWTFRYRGSWWSSLVRWLGIVGVAYALNLVVVIALHQDLDVDPYLAQFGGIVVYTVAAFLGGRHFAFRDLDRTVIGPAT